MKYIPYNKQRRMLKNRIKIVHLIYQLGAGGAENGIINIVNNIDSRLFESAICSFSNGGSRVKHLNSDVKYISMMKNDGNDFFLPFRLMKFFSKWKPDIVHTHAWGTLIEGLVSAKFASVPALVHGEHGTIQIKELNKKIQKYAWRCFDQVLSVSQEHKNTLMDIIGFPSRGIKVIPNGVNTDVFYPAVKKIRNKKIRIATIGRLVPVKNQILLIKAFQKVYKNSNAELIIVGDGPLHQDLELYVKQNSLTDNVVFTGQRFDIPDLLRSFDIFVLPSLREGMSNTILEAMSTGVTVIATAVGGNVELVDHQKTGLLINSGDHHALADNLLHLIENETERHRLGENARQRVLDNFSLDIMIRNYETLYKNLIK